jgi:hypothetical protein
MWRKFKVRQDEIRNSDMKDTRTTFMPSLLEKKTNYNSLNAEDITKF